MLDILGSKIDYIFEDNNKERTFVAIHGFASYYQRLSKVLKDVVLSKGYNYLSFSLPGHGASQSRVEDMNFDHFVDVFVAIIEQFKLTDLTIFGHSLGGGIALAAVKRLKERIKSVIVVGTISRNTPMKKQLFADSFLPKDIGGLKRLANLIFYFGEHVLLNPSVKERLIAEMNFFNSDAERLKRMEVLIENLLSNETIEDRIDEGIKLAPKLALAYGEGDRVVAEGISDYFLKLNPETKIKVLERAGHSP